MTTPGGEVIKVQIQSNKPRVTTSRDSVYDYFIDIDELKASLDLSQVSRIHDVLKISNAANL